jgi:hypothetical protein
VYGRLYAAAPKDDSDLVVMINIVTFSPHGPDELFMKLDSEDEMDLTRPSRTIVPGSKNICAAMCKFNTRNVGTLETLPRARIPDIHHQVPSGSQKRAPATTFHRRNDHRIKFNNSVRFTGCEQERPSKHGTLDS